MQVLQKCIIPLNEGRDCKATDKRLPGKDWLTTVEQQLRVSSDTTTDIIVSSKQHILWVLLGEWKHGKHVVQSVKQARLWNPAAVLVILASNNIASAVQTAVNAFNAKVISLTKYNSDKLLKAHNNVFFVSGDMGGIGNSNSKDFNRMTSQRLYYVHAWMHEQNVKNVIHLENDNMLYFDVADWVRKTSSCNVQVATTCRELRPTHRFFVAGIMYIRNAVALQIILTEFNKALAAGRKQLTAKFNTKYINDMSLLANYYWENMKEGKPPATYQPPPGLSIFPESAVNGLSADDSPGQVDLFRKCMWERGQMMFDNAALGIWFYGDFHQKTPKSNQEAWGAYQRIPAKDHGDLKWLGDKSKGLTYPEWNGARVASLHMHGKQLRKASSVLEKVSPALEPEGKE